MALPAGAARYAPAAVRPLGALALDDAAGRRPCGGARPRAADHRRRAVVEDRALQRGRGLGGDRHGRADAQAIGLQPELLVLLVAADQRVDRVALQPLRERAQLVGREPLLDEQVLAHRDLAPGALQRVEGVDRRGAVRVVQERERGHGRASYDLAAAVTVLSETAPRVAPQ